MITEPADEVRIGDAEREAAVGRLGDHLRAGRLTPAEYDERAATAFAARTDGQLRPLFADLPAGPPSREVAAAPARARRFAPPVPVLLVMVALVVGLSVAFTVHTGHPPVFLFALVWIAFAVRRRQHWGRHWSRSNGWAGGPYRHG